jgi:regulatory protein
MPGLGARKLDRKALMEYALKVLASRAHSTAELREKLVRRAQDSADTDAVLARLKEIGYLNDRRFAEGFALAEKETRGFGRLRVLRDLRARRVAPAVAAEAVAELFQGQDEAAAVEEYLRRKFRGKDLAAELQDERRLAAAFRRLRTAGFAAGPAIRVLKRYAAQAEQLEDIDDPGPEPIS